MKIRKMICFAVFLGSIAFVSCNKNPSDYENGDFLRFERATLNVLNKQGSSATIAIKSNLAWSLLIENPVPDWLTINKSSGNGNDSLTVVATKDNNTNGYKFANILASPINNSSIMPVRLTVVQYDSTFKGK